jgi:hypothetical protein
LSKRSVYIPGIRKEVEEFHLNPRAISPGGEGVYKEACADIMLFNFWISSDERAI